MKICPKCASHDVKFDSHAGFAYCMRCGYGDDSTPIEEWECCMQIEGEYNPSEGKLQLTQGICREDKVVRDCPIIIGRDVDIEECTKHREDICKHLTYLLNRILAVEEQVGEDEVEVALTQRVVDLANKLDYLKGNDLEHRVLLLENKFERMERIHQPAIEAEEDEIDTSLAEELVRRGNELSL